MTPQVAFEVYRLVTLSYGKSFVGSTRVLEGSRELIRGRNNYQYDSVITIV